MDAIQCISAFYFEYRRLRKIREIIQSAHTLTSDAMRRRYGRQWRDDCDIKARADIGFRLGVLGLGSAAITITGALALGSSNATPILIGVGLSSSALMGLHWLKTAANMQIPYLAVSGTWIAGLAYLTSMNPIGGSLSLVASLVFICRAQVFRKSPLGTDIEQKVPEVDRANQQRDEPNLLLDHTGCLTSSTLLGNLNLTRGDQLFDRVHIADRVQFLRALSQLRAGEVSELQLRLRLNTADNGRAAMFEDFDLEMKQHGDTVELRQSASPEVEYENSQDDSALGSDKRFLAIVSHELRTPLNAIIGFSDLLRSETADDLAEATRKEYVNLIHGAGSHLLSLVNTILDVSKIESGTYSIDRDEFDFPPTARECMAMLGGQAKQKNILLNDRIICPSGKLNADRRAVKQILINLLSNAIKYTDPNGFVTVDAQIDDAGLVLEVSDTGIGMSPDDLDTIAKPFTQVDNSITRNNEGTGLGLALVKGLVELHGGELEISSKLGVGTNVKVQIPNQPEWLQNDKLSDSKNSNRQITPLSESMSELQTFTRKEIGHGTRKAG